MKKLTTSQIYRLKKKAKSLTDDLGFLKEDRDFTVERINELTSEIKLILKQIGLNEIKADSFKSVFESFKKDQTDWKSLALSYKPSKIKISRFTKKSPIERLMTYELE